MRYIAVIVLAAILVFGCAGPAPPAVPGATPPIAPGGPEPGPSGEECTPSYSFSDLDGGVLSKTSSIVATVTCAAGKSIVVKLDGVQAASVLPESNATAPIKLEFYPRTEGTLKLTVESDGETVYSRDWAVVPLGNDETKGLENDAVSFKEWRAMAVDIENPISADKVRIFMKRIDEKTQPGTEIVVEIRDDKGGNPGNVISSVRRPTNVTTLSDNWITFDFEDDPALGKGRYWIVMRVDQTEGVTVVSDKVNVHYVPVDKQAEGNDYTRQMMLEVNQQTGEASETEWTPLSYDRIYTMILTGAKK
jgi:hypothetical protein